MHQTSECFHLVVEFCAGGGAAAGQATMAVVQAGSIISVGTALLQHGQEGHCKGTCCPEMIHEILLFHKRSFKGGVKRNKLPWQDATSEILYSGKKYFHIFNNMSQLSFYNLYLNTKTIPMRNCFANKGWNTFSL